MSRLFLLLKNSLQAKLSLASAAIYLLLAAAAGGFSFYDTYRETEKLQDGLLRQTAALASPGGGDLPDSDNDARIFIQRPGAKGRLDIPGSLPDGFHDLNDRDGDSYRVYLHEGARGRVAVIQENDYREDLAENAAWRSVMPLLLAIPLTILLTIWIISRAMRPVRLLSQNLGRRRDNDLSPLPQEGIPSEIGGFVTAINRLLARTGGSIRQQQRFIADAAHELRSPMTALSLQAERLDKLPLPPEAAQQAALLRQGIARNRHLLEQLLSLARAQSPEAARHGGPVSIRDIFRRVLEGLLPLAAAKRQDIGVAVEGDCEIHADDTAIRTLVQTLTDNAVRYTPPGGRIDLGFWQNADTLCLWVEDNGHGIPPCERERVLDPFYRILGTEQQGTGLGLSIADTIAKRYGGRITLSDSRRFSQGLLIQAELDKRLLSQNQNMAD
ncbi:MAG: ATP-binding protein [Neisseria sp.]|nr:ATP-binding protein [Neisseria sp.]